MLVRVLHHDHCFDGAASAAFFSRFLEDKLYPGARFEFTGLAHKADQLFEPSLFDGDVNAIVDFKYSTDPNLTWWFDHHQSAFLTPEDHAHFLKDASGKKMYDPEFRSCTKYIATMVQEKWGYEAPDLAELVHWADIIDGAQFASARVPVRLEEPALKLMTVIEANKDPSFSPRLIADMQKSIDESNKFISAMKPQQGG